MTFANTATFLQPRANPLLTTRCASVHLQVGVVWEREAQLKASQGNIVS